MKKIILFLILGITTQSHSSSESHLNDFLRQNMEEMNLISNKIKELELQIENSDGIEKIELTCEQRKVMRKFIALLDKTYNSEELIELSKNNSKFSQTRDGIKKAKENYKKSIEIYDEELRKEMNVKPEIKTITLDYTCKAWGY